MLQAGSRPDEVVYWASNRSEHQEPSGCRGRPERKVDDLTAIFEQNA
jgi:hypothetical protein